MEEKDLLFLGINIEKATKKLMNEKLDELGITKMTEAERNAFNYGVNLVYQLIDAVTTLEEDQNFVVLTDDEIGTEYTLEELMEK